ncbi:MAG: cyanase [Chloroflexi bacterium]|nr:MAG: cyanase [Chloroflexota bacterium]
MDREEATVIANDAREQRGLSWANLAEVAGRSKVWTTSALLGQQAIPAEVAQKVGAALGLDADVVSALQRSPSKGGLGDMIPTDPLMYRFYEILQVYGTTLKELIHEEFGDGIMSAIDFEMELDRLPDPKGDRVKVTMHGKFLPYRVW